jgi:hypothetical protein
LHWHEELRINLKKKNIKKQSSQEPYMPQPCYCTGHQQRPSQATACSPSTKGKKNSIKRGEHHKLMQCLKNINKTFT